MFIVMPVMGTFHAEKGLTSKSFPRFRQNLRALPAKRFLAKASSLTSCRGCRFDRWACVWAGWGRRRSGALCQLMEK